LIRAHAIVEAETYPLLTETDSQVHPDVSVWNMPETIIWNHPWRFSSLGGKLLQNCFIHTVTGCIEVGATRRQTLVVKRSRLSSQFDPTSW